MKIRFNLFAILIFSTSFYSEKIISSLPKPSFPLSKEQEIKKYVSYIKEKYKSEKTTEEIEQDILNCSFLLNHKDELFDLQQYSEIMNISIWPKRFQDIKKTFDKLKLSMNLPDEIQIKFCINQSLQKNSLMSYYFIDRTIFLYPLFFVTCPSLQLFQLIHELTHAQQDFKLGSITSQLERTEFETENYADLQAALAIKCPDCLDAIIANKVINEGSISMDRKIELINSGYMTGYNLSKIKETASMNDLCNLHKRIRTEKPLTLEEKFNIDCQHPDLYDRLSTIQVQQI